jgi:predicted membrane protein
MQMRKLKKSGFTLYAIGELAPLAVSAGLLGFSFFGGIMMALSAIIAILFVILYATQRKYLVN